MKTGNDVFLKEVEFRNFEIFNISNIGSDNLDLNLKSNFFFLKIKKKS